MALLTTRRHIVRYVLIAAVLLVLCYQFLIPRGPYRTSTHRHLKDPVQELKDAGTYVPVHQEPPQKQVWPEPQGQGSTSVNAELQAAGEALRKSAEKGMNMGEKEKVDTGVLNKIASVESERSATMKATTQEKATPTRKDYATNHSPTRVPTAYSSPSHTKHTSAAHAKVTPVDDISSSPITTTRKGRPTPHAAQPASLQVSAHTIASADAFLPHFSALPEQKNLTVRDAMASCTWPSSLPVNFQYGADAEWAVNIRNSSDIEKHREGWQRFILEETIPWTDVEDRFEGRGIVVVAGNERSLKRTFVLLRLLKHFETDLPVEIHYHGSEELSAKNKTNLKIIYSKLSFSDLEDSDQPVKTSAPGFINYNLKTAALLNSRFAEPLLLDSDNLPVSDPAVLYKSKTYKEYGTIFWPDIARTRPENPIWALTNTACRMDEYEQESGQLLVDKRKYWYHLQLAKWWSDRAYYEEFLLGDKDTFRFAWRALRTEYGRPKRWLSSIGVVQRPRDERPFPGDATLKGGIGSTSVMSAEREEGKTIDKEQGAGVYCGHSFGQHHPDSEDGALMFMHGGLVKTLAPQQIMHARKYGRGLFAAYKDSPYATSWDEIEKVGIKYDTGAYLEQEAQNAMEYPGQCTDMVDVVPGALGDKKTSEAQGFEAVAEEAGFYWMVERIEGGV